MLCCFVGVFFKSCPSTLLQERWWYSSIPVHYCWRSEGYSSIPVYYCRSDDGAAVSQYIIAGVVMTRITLFWYTNTGGVMVQLYSSILLLEGLRSSSIPVHYYWRGDGTALFQYITARGAKVQLYPSTLLLEGWWYSSIPVICCWRGLSIALSQYITAGEVNGRAISQYITAGGVRVQLYPSILLLNGSG